MNRSTLDQYHLHKEDPSARQFELFDLKEYLSKNLEHGSVPHSHSFYQVIWFESDKGAHHIDFNAHPIAKDRVFLVAKNQVHYFDTSTVQEGVLMHFNETFLLRNETDIELFLQYGLFNSDSPYVQLSSEYKTSLKGIKGAIEHELAHKSEFGHRLVISQLLRAMLTLLERLKRNHLGAEQNTPQLTTFLKFRDALEEGFKTDQSVEAYAKLVHVSSKTLSNYCKKESGKSPSELIIARRILEAKRLLLHTDALVNQVGYSLGFDDPSYFVKFFKKQVGMTPLQFRKSISE